MNNDPEFLDANINFIMSAPSIAQSFLEEGTERLSSYLPDTKVLQPSPSTESLLTEPIKTEESITELSIIEDKHSANDSLENEKANGYSRRNKNSSINYKEIDDDFEEEPGNFFFKKKD